MDCWIWSRGWILSSTFGDPVESEYFQPGVYYNSASTQMFGAFAKKNFKVTRTRPVLKHLQAEPACQLTGIPLSETLMAEQHVTNDMVLNWCERAGGMRSQFSVTHGDQNRKCVIVSLAVSLTVFRCSFLSVVSMSLYVFRCRFVVCLLPILFFVRCVVVRVGLFTPCVFCSLLLFVVGWFIWYIP